MTTETFGPMLRRLRQRQRLSCLRLATAAGTDPSYISKVERGDRYIPPRQTVERLINGLGLLSPAERFALWRAAGYWSAEAEQLLGHVYATSVSVSTALAGLKQGSE